MSSDIPKSDKFKVAPMDPTEPIPDKYIIFVADVEKQVMKMNIWQAPDADNLPIWVLRYFAGVLAPPICYI